MTSKKQPPKKPAPVTPDPAPPLDPQALLGAPLDTLMEALGKISGQLQGMEGAEMRRHVADVKGQVQGLVQTLKVQADDRTARTQAAAEVERMIESLAQTGTAAGRAIEKHREPIAQAFRGVDLSKLGDGLRLLADWMQNPTPEAQAQVERLIAQLQETMGPVVGWDPAREEAERSAAIKRDVQASLDEIFRGKPKPT